MAYPELPIWPFVPNWSGTVTETLSWLTDILTSKTGAEQRRSLRQWPKQTLEYVTLLTRKQHRLHNNLVTGFGRHDWMLPMWFDTHNPEIELIPGAMTIPCRTARFGDFHANGWIMLVSRADPQAHRILQIASVDSFGFNLIDPVPSAADIGTQIVPLKRARFTEQPNVSRVTDDVATGDVSFTIMESNIRKFSFKDASTNGPLIQSFLTARQYQSAPDGSPFNPVAGTTDSHVIMTLACFRASEALLKSEDPYLLEASDYYNSLAFSMLDAFLGDGSGRGAIVRQDTSALTLSTLALPHWLYAAKDDIEDVVNVGEGYEMIPYGVSSIPDGFASADPQTFRDIETLLTIAIRKEKRPGKPWSVLRGAFRKTNFESRKGFDGRDIIVPLINYPVVPLFGEPKGLFTRSNHPRANANTLPESVGFNEGANLISRLSDGDVFANIPESVEYQSVQDPNNPDATIVTPIQRLSTTQIGRNFVDRWRLATSYQKADYYLFLQVGINRALDVSKNENIRVELYGSGVSWVANITAENIVSANGVATLLIPRDRFTNANGALPAGQTFTGFNVVVDAIAAYSLRVRAMRLVAGSSAAAVVADVNTALKGETIAYSPGVAPFRVSANLDQQRYIGFNGVPYIGAQRPDFWVEVAPSADNHYAGIGAGSLSVVSAGQTTLTYPISQLPTSTPASLIAEQNVLFMQNSQKQFVIDGGDLGPFAHTFVTNIEDRRFIPGAEPHRWVYEGYLPIQSLFWQARAVESLCRMQALSAWNGIAITYKGIAVTFNGQQLKLKLQNEDSMFNIDQAKSWDRVRDIAETVAINFLNWYFNDWPGKNYVTVNGEALTFNGQYVLHIDRSRYVENLAIANNVVNPSVSAPNYTEPSPHIAAVILRAALWLKISRGPTYKRFDGLMVLCWNYLELFWRDTAPMQYTWSTDRNSGKLYSLHHGEIMLTISKMIERLDLLPVEIDPTILQSRLALTRLSFEDFLVGDNAAQTVPAFDKNYRGYSVMIDNTNEKNEMSIEVARMAEELDNDIGFPIQKEYNGIAFNKVARPWWVKGRERDYKIRAILWAMRGRCVPVWVPTLMQDFKLANDIAGRSDMLTVENCGYALSGGPRQGRQHISISLNDGTEIFREIVQAQETGSVEMLTLDQNISVPIMMSDVRCISFIELMRFDQDQFEIGHVTDTAGISTFQTYFKSVTETRKTRAQ